MAFLLLETNFACLYHLLPMEAWLNHILKLSDTYNMQTAIKEIYLYIYILTINILFCCSAVRISKSFKHRKTTLVIKEI